MIPDTETIYRDVKAYIGSHANYDPKKIKETHTLKGQPLKLDDGKLVFLALSLRGYIKAHRPSATLLVGEIRKSDFTVGNTCELVKKRIHP